MKSKKIYVAYCTFPDEKIAQAVCKKLVEENTIACANILGPMRSLYKWKGKLNEDTEVAAILKTSSLKRATLKERIRALHPYENPCLVFLPVEDGLPAFLRWVSAQSF